MTPESRWIGVFSALLLLTGILLGIAMDRFLFRPPMPPPGLPGPALSESPGEEAGQSPARLIAARIARELDLTEAQRGEMRRIFREHLPKLREARGEGGDFQAARREMNAAIAEILTSEQREKFQSIRRRQRDSRRRMLERYEERVGAE